MSDAFGTGNWFKTAWEQHRLPLLLLVLPVGLVVLGAKLEFSLIFAVLPLAAFVIGVVLRPRHVWLIWLGAVVIQWIAMGVLGVYADPEGETVLSLIIEAFAWMAMGVLLPVWLGRTVGKFNAQGRGSGSAPSRPTS